MSIVSVGPADGVWLKDPCSLPASKFCCPYHILGTYGWSVLGASAASCMVFQQDLALLG